MAERRMFSKSIVCSDEFLEMPDSTQCLYFHLSMNADDDGFVDKPKAIVRMIGAKEDDLKVLLTKSFVLPFDTGVIVIRHWRLNNYIQKDRKKETIYQAELDCLRIDSSGAYTFGDGELLGDNTKNKNPLTKAQQLRLDAKKESELPYSFEYKIKAQFVGKECPICGKTMTTYSKKTQPTIQHNLPISKGGKHELGNISIICGECNYSIQDKETEKLNSEEVSRVWNEIQNENVSGMDTQNRIGKVSIEENKKESIKEKKHHYGKYGWFVLSDAEIERLNKEFGKTYIEKVIDILDEQVQSTGNKNKYKDWNLVIRKAIRDKWSCLNSISKSKEIQLDPNIDGLVL